MTGETPVNPGEAARPGRSGVSTVAERPGAAEDLAPEQLLEALWAEQRRCWLRGEGVPARVYLECHPALAADAERAADLIYHEFIVREEAGAAPPFADYLRDYAPYASQLQDLHEADHAAGQRPAAARRLGDYELLEEVGRGGMGVVYKARQVSLNRAVAVKRLLAGSWASPGEVRRFLQEAEAAGRLQHPNIVAVHAVGEQDGQPYFSMDLVAGKSLAALVRESPLPAARAAAYVRTLAEAVHYAHGQGVLHRDLKPSNVLIDANDQPRITDFGLAKWTAGGAQLTATGAVVGTPSYMPPEQAVGRHGPVGPASDVYALGAILYELLTGRPPFRAETPLDTLKQVLEAEPAGPRLLNPTVPRDLATVCLKCLQKEPGKRYATARELADDLRRFLSGEPIQARPVGPVGRAWRWCRRNPAKAALVILVPHLVLALAVGSAVAAFRINAQARAEAAAKEKAERHFAQLARTYLRLAEITQAVSSTKEAIRLYQETLSLFGQLAREQPVVSDHQWNVAQIHRKLGSLYRDTDRLKEAEAAFRTALERIEPLVQGHPGDAGFRRVKAQTLADLGRLYGAMNQPDRAKELMSRARDIYTRLVQDQPGVTDYQRDLALAHNSLGVLYRWEPGRALANFRAARKIQERLVRAHGDNLAYRDDLANTHYNLGNLWSRNGPRLDRAEAAYLRALELREGLADKHPQVHSYQMALAKCLGSLAGVYQATARPDRAAKAYRRAMSLLEDLIQVNPTLSDYALSFAVTAAKLGDLEGESAPAKLGWYTRAIGRLEGILRRDAQNAFARQFLRGSLDRRARVLTIVGRYAEAVRDWDRAIESSAGAERDALRLARAGALAHAGRHARAATEANELAGKAAASGEVLYQAACVYSLSSAAVLRDGKLPRAERDRLAGRYAGRALDLLTRARASGYFKAPARLEELRKDTDLDPLRTRPGFQTWLRELEKG